MAVVAVTRTVIRRPAHVVRFARGNIRVLRQLRRTPGFVTGALGYSTGAVFWTMTVWSDGRAMTAFRNGGAHAEEVPRMAGWAEEASTSLWRSDDESLPSWEEAHAHLAERARFHPVIDPNEYQRTHVVPATRGGVLTLPIRSLRRPG